MNYVGLNIHGNTFDTTTFQYGFWHAIRWMINNARYIFLSAKSLTRSKANPQQQRCQLRVEQHRESMLSGVDVFSLSHSPIDLTTLGRLLFQSPATTLFPRALIRTWLTFCVPPRPVSQRTPLLNTAASLKQMSKKRAETAQLLPALPARASERWIWKNGVWPRSYLCSDLRAHKFVTREEYYAAARASVFENCRRCNIFIRSQFLQPGAKGRTRVGFHDKRRLPIIDRFCISEPIFLSWEAAADRKMRLRQSQHENQLGPQQREMPWIGNSHSKEL